MKNKKGFTLAEVLITLTIIGVVAALTIPALLSNVTDKTYESKRKGLQTRLAQALSQMDSLNSYEDKTDPEKNSSMNFVIEGLSKVYKITNVCEFDNFAACDFPESFGRWFDTGRYYTKDYRKLTIAYYNVMTAENMGGLATDAVAFKSKNGESFLLWYNPRCVAEQDVDSENKKMWTKEVCAAMIIDLDGAKKGPNITGRDIMYSIVLYPDTPYIIIAPVDYADAYPGKPSYSATGDNAENFCSTLEMYNLKRGTLTLPNRERIYLTRALYWGRSLNMWSSSIEGSGPDDYGWMVNTKYAFLMPRKTISDQYWCVKRDGL